MKIITTGKKWTAGEVVEDHLLSRILDYVQASAKTENDLSEASERSCSASDKLHSL